MSEPAVAAFFYGLFMDESLLGSKGIRPSRRALGFVDGYRLRIGTRATLEAHAGSRAYGFLMTIRRDDLVTLYSENSVADYVTEKVTVELESGAKEPAVCYLLPPGRLEGTNTAYAESLLQLATRLGFPDHYLAEIRKQGRHE